MRTIKLPKPNDWHCHLRDNDVLPRTVNDTAAQFSSALIMPNLVPPVTTVALATNYRQRILAALSENQNFTPHMTLYLTDQTSPTEIIAAKESEFVLAAKLYPAGATTNSDSGVTDINKLDPVLAALEETGLTLCVHGEVTDPSVDIFDREAVFIDSILQPILKKFPKLRVVLEHITSREAATFINSQPNHVVATITAHHLFANRSDMLAGGIKPHLYCLPILKRERDRQALIKAAISGSEQFFLGTDSAPHAQHAKESACGCAGIYTAHAALPLYAQIFDQHNALEKLPNFASQFGANFYKVKPSKETITLSEQPWVVPESLKFGNDTLIPFAAGQTLQWQVNND